MKREVHLGKKVIVLSNMLQRRINQEASKFGITGIQARIIGFVYHRSDKKDIFQRDIEEEFNIRRSSVTSVLQLMEKNGYIKRVSVSDDARLKKILLTEKGAEIQKNVYDFILKLEKSLKDELSDDEFETIINLIDRLSKKVAD